MQLRTMLRPASLVLAVAGAVAVYGSPAQAAPAAERSVPQAPVVQTPARTTPVPSAAPGKDRPVAELPDTLSAARQAKAQGSRVRVTASGTAQTQTYVNPNGTLTTESYAAPAFRRAGATWVPLSGAVTGAGTAADPLRAAGLARPVTLGRSAAKLVELAAPGGTVTLGAPGLTLGTPTRAGSTVTWAGAARDADLQLVTSPAGVRTNLVLRSAAAPRSYRFHLADPMGTLGAVAEQKDGSWLFAGSMGDGYQLALAPPVAFESGRAAEPASATQTVVRAGDGFDVTLAVDPAWLAGKSYPIVLDPDLTLVAGGSGGVDCHLTSGSLANNNYCPQATRDIGFETSVIRRTIAMFPVTSLPANAQISAADLDLYLITTSAATGPVDIRAHRVTSGWNQSATWNDNGGGSAWAGGSIDAAVQTTTTVDTAAGHKHWALPSQLVTDWRNVAYGNYGVLLRAVNEGAGGTFRFASANATDTTQRPRLTVTYTDPAALQVDQADSYIPVLSGLVSGSGSYTTTFTVTPPTGLGAAFTRAAAGSTVAAGSRATYRLTDSDGLVAGRTYTWTMKTCVGSACTTSATQSFTVDPLIASGDRGFFTYRDWQLSDRLKLRVNAASGNLLAEATDLSVPGITGDVTLGRTYNSLAVAPGSQATAGTAGAGWTTAVGTDTDVELHRDGSATVRTPSGYAALFRPAGVNFAGPQGINATLSRVDGGWRYKEHGSGATWTYDANGRLTSIKDRSGNATTIRRDGSGNVSAVDGARGPNDPMAGQSARRVIVNDGVSPSTGSLRNYTQLPNPGSPLTARSVVFSYTGTDLTAVTDAGNKTTTFGYDTSHRLTSVTTPSDANTVAHKTVIAYESGTDRVASVRQETTAAGVGPLTVFSYDDVNKKTTVTPPNVNAAGNPQRNTTYDWDVRHRVTKLTNGFGKEVSKTTFNTNSQVSTSGNSTGNTTTNAYASGDENLTQSSSTQGPTSNFADYGSAGTSTEFLPGSSTNGSMDKSLYRYDGAGNLSANTNAGGSEAIVERNSNGTVKFTTDPNNTADGTSKAAPACVRGSTEDNCSLYTYTSNQLTGIAPPDGSGLANRSYTYDGFDRLATVSNGSGNTVTYSYDALDRTTKADSSKAGDVDVTYTFDADGNRIQRVDGTGTTTYRYDKLNRLTLKGIGDAAADCSAGATNTRLCYAYDDASNLVSLRDGRGTTGYHYSPISLLDMVNEHTGRTIVMAYDDDQRRTQTWFATDIPANGTVYTASNQLTVPQTWVLQTRNTLDTAGRLTRTVSWRGNVADDAHRVSDLSYNYKQVTLNTVCTNGGATVGRGVGTDAGRKTERTNNMVTGQVIQYCYDTSGRLIFRAGSGAALYKYTYDKSGNRTGDSVNNDPLTTYTFNSGNETTTSGFTYDAAGNQKTGAPFSATASVYNGFDQATAATPAGGSSIALAAAGTTNSETVTQGATTLTNGVPGEQALSTGGTPSYLQRDPKGGLLALVVGSGATNEYYYVLDGQGSVTNLVDAAGTERARYGYDAWGGNDSAVGVNGALPNNPYRYNGGRVVATNASNQAVLYQFGERFYAPFTGRWTQQDNLESLGDPAQGNRYAYAGNDPVNNTDPSGRFTMGDFVGNVVGGAIAAGFTAVGAATGYALGGPAGAVVGARAGLFVGGCVGGFVEDNLGTMIDGDEAPTEADAIGSCAAGAVSATLFS